MKVTLPCSLALGLMLASGSAYGASRITAIWANSGEDKVTRDELRASHGASVINPIWDGAKISLFGARNEVVDFNLILEAATNGASNLTISFSALSGPSGAAITSSPATGDGVFDWTQRQIELFYVRYLQIKGLSIVANDIYDERLIPKNMRRPWSGDGMGRGTWQDRPGHDKFYPDIAVPLELVPNFTVPGGSNQSIWVDIYIPKSVPEGAFWGNIIVREAGALIAQIPVQLKVFNFTLPESPSAKTMLSISSADLNTRYLGSKYIDPASAAGAKARLIRNRHFMLAHRHRISLIGDFPVDDCNMSADEPCPEWLPRLDGSLFTTAHGYDGPGVQTGNGIYSIGTYGSWSWKTGTEADMDVHTDAWATWFNQNAPMSDYFLYLIDESTNTPQIETWSQWILNNSGPGRAVKSLATIDLRTAGSQTPSLDIPASTFDVGIASQWQPLADRYTVDSRQRFFLYNGHRPGSGSFATEDDGVALRELAWGQYKKHINRWFFWEATYYNNYQGGAGDTNVFQTAQTMGTHSSTDPVIGQTGWSYGNGDGVLFYPGTDALFPSDSYGVEGPFASLRLKHWRRGIQDVDYLTMAAAVDPFAVETIVNQMIPKVLWEYGVTSVTDPTYIRTDISWSVDPQGWETARARLATIIAGGGSNPLGPMPAPTLNLPPVLPVNAEITAGYPGGYNIAAFQWSILPVADLSAAQHAFEAPAQRTAVSSHSTASPTAQLAEMNLALGDYQISVVAIDGANNMSPSAQATVKLVPAGFSSIKVYPNPWRSGQSYGRRITFDLLPANAMVSLYSVAGHLVKTLPANESAWDLTNASGELVSSGIYLYVIHTPDGQFSRGKLAVIK